MPNKLVDSASPYLLQHANNPVDWYPWGDEAIEKAVKEDKPILLSIGYAACHWCHVMAHESFEDAEIASFMNEHFVNIKVDREQRPDLDNIYMQAVVAMSGQGGWPLTVFLTPDLEPFWGGTYFPPVPSHNMPSFRDVLGSIFDAWHHRRDDVVAASSEISRHLRRSITTEGGGEINSELVRKAAQALIEQYDWRYGGWGKAPKFPQPMALEFLLRRIIAQPPIEERSTIIKLVEHALTAMAKGGMYDVVGGGFSRYSTDNNWLVPHFEKMLYDNALLSRVYLHAFIVTGDRSFRKVCLRTLEFMADELNHPGGGFYSSLDADSEGIEGKYYLWTPEEVSAAISDRADWDLFQEMYPLSESGNFDGKNIIRAALDVSQLAETRKLPIEEVERKLDASLDALKLARSKRVRPGLDDKIVLVWNCLAMLALFEGYEYLGFNWLK